MLRSGLRTLAVILGSDFCVYIGQLNSLHSLDLDIYWNMGFGSKGMTQQALTWFPKLQYLYVRDFWISFPRLTRLVPDSGE